MNEFLVHKSVAFFYRTVNLRTLENDLKIFGSLAMSISFANDANPELMFII